MAEEEKKPLWETELDNISKKKKLGKSGSEVLPKDKVELFLSYLNQDEKESLPPQLWQDFLTFLFMQLMGETTVIGSMLEAFKAGRIYERNVKELESNLPANKTKIVKMEKMDYLLSCIDNWRTANQGKGKEVEFFGAFTVLDPKKDFKVTEDRMLAYGVKEIVQDSLKEIGKMVKADKEEFLNW